MFSVKTPFGERLFGGAASHKGGVSLLRRSVSRFDSCFRFCRAVIFGSVEVISTHSGGSHHAFCSLEYYLFRLDSCECVRTNFRLHVVDSLNVD